MLFMPNWKIYHIHHKTSMIGCLIPVPSAKSASGVAQRKRSVKILNQMLMGTSLWLIPTNVVHICQRIMAAGFVVPSAPSVWQDMKKSRTDS
jgi:hypothetical protein